MFPELAALRPGLAIKPVLAQLTTTFPDLEPTIEDILQDRNEVIVRARMAGVWPLSPANHPAP